MFEPYAPGALLVVSVFDNQRPITGFKASGSTQAFGLNRGGYPFLLNADGKFVGAPALSVVYRGMNKRTDRVTEV